MCVEVMVLSLFDKVTHTAHTIDTHLGHAMTLHLGSNCSTVCMRTSKEEAQATTHTHTCITGCKHTTKPQRIGPNCPQSQHTDDWESFWTNARKHSAAEHMYTQALGRKRHAQSLRKK